MVTETQAFDAIVLTGGAARRLDGADKPGLLVGSASLLERTLAALGAARHTIVVGPRRPVSRPVLWCQEDPPGSGPLAAVAAGARLVRSEFVLVLASDMPGIAPAVAALLAGVTHRGGADAALLADATGRRHYLAAAWRTASLRRALSRIAVVDGVAVRRLYEHTAVTDILDTEGWSLDCDTWEQLRAARRHEERGSGA